jgi:hypothetical protein
MVSGFIAIALRSASYALVAVRDHRIVLGVSLTSFAAGIR